MSVYVSHLIANEDMISIKERYSVGIEIVNFASAISLDNKEKELSILKNHLKGHIDNRVSIHGPYEDMSPGSPDKRIRRVTMERFQECYDIAKREFKAERIVFHSGFIPRVSYDKEWLNNSKEFWREFLQDKLQDNISIHVENVFEEDYRLLKELIDYINNPSFSICLDIGHKNACSRLPIEEWIMGLGKRIGYVHLHNNYGKGDEHNPLEEGSLNMQEVFKLLEKYSSEAHWCIEVFSKEGIEASLKSLKKNGYI